MKKHLSVRYGTIQGCYWMGYAALMGYASVYLLEKGFTNTQIGLLTAVGCIVSAVLQPALASLLMSLESVFAALFGWLLLGQTLSARELFGCAVMFAAIILSQLPERRKGAV